MLTQNVDILKEKTFGEKVASYAEKLRYCLSN